MVIKSLIILIVWSAAALGTESEPSRATVVRPSWSFSPDIGPSEAQFRAFREEFPDECLSRESCEENMAAKAKDPNHDGTTEFGHCVGDRHRQGLEMMEAIKACDPQLFPDDKPSSRAPVDRGAGVG